MFSPLCATGRGANGSGGGPPQNRPPQAYAGCAPIPSTAAPTTTAVPARTSFLEVSSRVMWSLRFALLRSDSAIDDADPLVVRVRHEQVSGRIQRDAARAIQQRLGGR